MKMNTEQSTGAPQNTDLQVRATVYNLTGQDMILADSDLSWGKWIQSPGNVPSCNPSSFSAQGASLTPSGTEGKASWKLGDAIIRVTFNTPAAGDNTQSIECSPANQYKVRSWGTQGKVNEVAYTITRP
jgi:hypothetical protein